MTTEKWTTGNEAFAAEIDAIIRETEGFLAWHVDLDGAAAARLELLRAARADLEAADRYRELARRNPHLRREYEQRAAFSERFAKDKFTSIEK